MVDAPYLLQGRPLIVDAGDLPDHAAERHKNDERIQPSILGERRAQKDFLGVTAYDGIRPLVQQCQRLRQKIRRGGIKPGLSDKAVRAQALRQLGGKGLPFRLAGILAQQQAGWPGKAGQPQPDQSGKLQTGTDQPGDPAPAGGEQFRQIAGQPVELYQQDQHRQHDEGGHYLQKVLQHRQPPMTREKIIRRGTCRTGSFRYYQHERAAWQAILPQGRSARRQASALHIAVRARAAGMLQTKEPYRHRRQREELPSPTNKQQERWSILPLKKGRCEAAA